MSKEKYSAKECIEVIKANGVCNPNIQKYFDELEELLTEYEAIKNSNPSEALECLDIIGDIELSHTETCCNETKEDEYTETLVEFIDGILKDNYKEEFTTIKQALLKAQEQEKENTKYKNLEEHLGCPLDVFVKATINGIIVDYSEYKVKTHKDKYGYYFALSNGSCFPFYLSKYKKTWWLKKDKSE